MQHAQHQTNAHAPQPTEAVQWVFDQDSGWEHDDDVEWIIDEGNAAEWKDGNTYWLPPVAAE